MNEIELIQKEVHKLLNKDDSGHAMDHIKRVLNLSLKFAKKENADEKIVSLIALLHDVDDYKLFGNQNAEELTNAKNIMNNVGIEKNVQEEVIASLKNIGYSNALKGFRPTLLEGQIVSDADMCDALGVNGIIRTYKYSLKHSKPFFDKNIFPIENMSAEKYTRKCSDSSVCHLFEKVLKLKKLMLTESGKKEAEKRHEIVVNILYNLFDEEDAPNWKSYLDNYLSNEYCK